MIELAPDFATAGVEVGFGWVEAEVEVAPGDAALSRAMEQAMATATIRLADRRPQDLPAVAATRQAYRALGKDPARYRPAAEALLRRVALGKGLFQANNVVEINNLLSLETGFSIGTYDVARLHPPLVFRRGRAGETYEGIGRGPLNLEGLPVFVDALGPFGSPTSDSVRTMVGSETGHIMMVLVGFAPAMIEPLHLARARALLEAHCRARVAAARLVPAG